MDSLTRYVKIAGHCPKSPRLSPRPKDRAKDLFTHRVMQRWGSINGPVSFGVEATGVGC